jgi:gamma-glutamylcyclotransferase (GGCT)/AIG2-like uncharacterized protein YtfP
VFLFIKGILLKSMDNLDESLIVYGTLAPGGRYHYLLADLPGTWVKCVIRGQMGDSKGFKAFRYEESGPEHPAWLVTPKALPQKFPELDAFEGESYRRRVISARVGRRRVWAHIYEVREFS